MRKVVLQISAAVAAAAFVVLVLFAVRVLQAVKATLERTGETVETVSKETLVLAREASATLQEIRRTTERLEGRLKQVDPLLASIRQTGETVQTAAHAAHQVTGAIAEVAVHAADQVTRHQNRIAETASWLTAGIKLWKAWKPDGKPETPSKENKE
ncbi:DUF948 domain-containing protein [Paenibacillus aurantius]|uniref:DUF948 domain-containing protein n=1 Tax=Paenibacillus aurantius TaxID=2918900 RepID=A0AA96LA35_9BACL|nr:DUF948 domain-containing protein [Paenibacillus aurantius]WNQ09816.1 DUF948 domain-containing protein [Paenibacillus aurantius]